MKVVCDSTALIGLAKMGKLELLEKIYGEIFILNAVFVESEGGHVSTNACKIVSFFVKYLKMA